jgi:lysophospholipase L1-like esterase
MVYARFLLLKIAHRNYDHGGIGRARRPRRAARETAHPRLELFKDDKLHFLPPGYAAVAAILQPVLARIWAEPH